MDAIADQGRQRFRVLRFLSLGPAACRDAAAARRVLLDGGSRGTISTEPSVVAEMTEGGLITTAGHTLSLSDMGRAAAKRAASATTSFQDQHRDLDSAIIDTGSGPDLATVNWAESPLAQLMRRKTKDGRPFLITPEYEAGERLRADYTRGQIMPRLGANWEARVSSGKRQGGVADLTDAALSARLRVERAIVAVGPELSGILIDVCCFLKGMEIVEAERGWPVRSAKIVLKTALGVLSRHYNPSAQRQERGRTETLHWGASDYRPSIAQQPGGHGV